MMLAAAERHSFLDVGLATVLFPLQVVVDLAIANRHRAAPNRAARIVGGDLLALALAVAAPGSPEVQRHASAIHRLLALNVVLPAQAIQRPEADRTNASSSAATSAPAWV